MRDEIWNLNRRLYRARHGEISINLIQIGSPHIVYRYYAEVRDSSGHEVIGNLEVRITGIPVGLEENLDKSVLSSIALTRIQRFLIGDRDGWHHPGGYTFYLSIPLLKCNVPEKLEISPNSLMTIEWSQIIEGKQEDETYIVSGVGQVFVDSSDIERAQKLGGNPLVEVSDATAADSDIPQFVISRFIPRSKDSQVIAARDNRRLLGLRQVFEKSGGSTQKRVSWPNIVATQDWSEDEGNDALFF